MKKILIIDDNDVFAETAADMLRANDMEVARAHDGVEGLSVNSEFKPDLILLDIEMPNLDGIGFLEQIREAGSEVAVLITTNRSDLDMIGQGVELGINGYIVKSNMPLDSIVASVKAELGVE